MKKFLQIHDQHSKIFGHRILNSQLTLYLGIVQLFVCLWAFCQHFYSIFVFNEILHCDFENSTDVALLTGCDAIIFDIGLFHSLWGIHGCVAEHLDGGYGRFGWCICHIGALLFCLPFAFVSRPKPFYLWPLLIQQSAYGIGLLILSLAALPRILPTFMGDLENAPLLSILLYLFGICMNFFLLLVLWHWYWWDSARKVRNDQLERMSANRKSRPTVSPPKKFSADMQEAKSLQLISNGSTVMRKDIPMNGMPSNKPNGGLSTTTTSMPKQSVPNHSPSNLSQSSRLSSLTEKNSSKHESITQNLGNKRKNGTSMIGFTKPITYQNEYSSEDEDEEKEYLNPTNLTRKTVLNYPLPYSTGFEREPNQNVQNYSKITPHLQLSSVYSLMQPTIGKSPYAFQQQYNYRNYFSLQDNSPRTDL